jgi:hypothetical protein
MFWHSMRAMPHLARDRSVSAIPRAFTIVIPAVSYLGMYGDGELAFVAIPRPPAVSPSD